MRASGTRAAPPALLAGLLLVSACAVGPPPGGLKPSGLADGIYEGSYFSFPMRAAVRVSVSGGKITGIELLQHWGWKGQKAGPVVIGRILERQSLAVDAVSGATSSSHVILRAVRNALQKAGAK